MSRAERAADRAWRENRELREALRHLQDDGGDGNGGDMDLWQQSVENRLTELSSRVLWLAGGIAGSFVILLTVFLTQISATNSRVDGLGDRLGKVEATVERLDERTAAMQKQQGGMDAKLDKLLAQ